MVTIVSTNTVTTPANTVVELPRIVTSAQRAGAVYTVDPGSMTGITSYQWGFNGSPVTGAVGAAYTAPAMPHGAQVFCFVTGDQGTARTPDLQVYHAHATASHNTMDDAVLALIPHQPATHIAISDGDWSTAGTWDAGTVPSAGAIVLVPFGRTVAYDVTSSPRLDRLRIDGLLNFAIDQSTDLLVETIVVTQSGELRIGTPGGRLPLNHTATLRFSDRAYTVNSAAPTDLDFANDPTLISRGLLWHGKVSIWSANVTPWLRTAASSAPMTGDLSLTLESIPENWAVGDQIIIGGTFGHVPSATDIFTHETEVRTIATIVDDTITWSATVAANSGPLLYDHDHQNPAITTATDLQPAIANKKRNVIMKTEAPHEDAVWRRAHTMAMHGRAIADIWGVSFLDMGRTDKSRNSGIIFNDAGTPKFRVLVGNSLVNDPAGQVLSAQSNVQSRYPVHMHFVGFNRESEKSVIQDCYVQDAPAWAYVHHGCEADFFDNVGYAFVGVGMVAETADEIGAWVGNLMVGVRRGFNGDRASQGNPKTQEDPEASKGDFGFTGLGMYFRGRAIRANNNFVMACPTAYLFFHRGTTNEGGTLSIKRRLNRDTVDVYSLSSLHWENGFIDNIDIPIRHFAGNECAGIPGYGFMVTKSGPGQSHALAINIKNNKFWAVGIGTHLEYVARYNFLDNRFYGASRNPGGKPITGFRLATLHISNVRNYLEGFDKGFALWAGTRFGFDEDFLEEDVGGNLTNPKFLIIDPTFVSVTEPIDYDETVPAGVTRGFTTFGSRDSTRLIDTTPAEVELTWSGPQPAYSWDGSTSTTSITLPGVTWGLRVGDNGSPEIFENPPFYTITPFFATDSIGPQPFPVVYDKSGLYGGQADHSLALNDTVERNAQTANSSGYLLQDLANRDGYWQYDTGSGIVNVLRFPLWISDRVSGRPEIVTILVECTGSVTSYTDNGALTIAAKPVRADVAVDCPINSPGLVIDILTAATLGEAGGTLSLGRDLVKPDYGELVKVGDAFNNGDGTITYIPDRSKERKAGDVDDVFYIVIEDNRNSYKTIRLTVTPTAAV